MIKIALDPTLDLADVAASAADLAIRCGDGTYPDVAKRLRLADWTAWSAAKGMDLRDCDFRQLTDYNIVLQAAMDGQGLAIGRQLLVGEHLASGRLVPVFPDAVVSPRLGYWLVSARHRRPSKAMTASVDWLKAEMEAAARAGAKERPARGR